MQSAILKQNGALATCARISQPGVVGRDRTNVCPPVARKVLARTNAHDAALASDDHAASVELANKKVGDHERFGGIVTTIYRALAFTGRAALEMPCNDFLEFIPRGWANQGALGSLPIAGRIIGDSSSATTLACRRKACAAPTLNRPTARDARHSGVGSGFRVAALAAQDRHYAR